MIVCESSTLFYKNGATLLLWRLFLKNTLCKNVPKVKRERLILYFAYIFGISTAKITLS